MLNKSIKVHAVWQQYDSQNLKITSKENKNHSKSVVSSLKQSSFWDYRRQSSSCFLGGPGAFFFAPFRIWLTLLYTGTAFRYQSWAIVPIFSYPSFLAFRSSVLKPHLKHICRYKYITIRQNRSITKTYVPYSTSFI